MTQQKLIAFEVTGKALFGRTYVKKAYDKADVDKVIADKDAKILALDAEVFKQKHHAKQFFDERNYAETQLRHQTYKRCKTMAEMCCEKKENCYNRALRKYSKDEADYLVRKSDFWQDWEFRWLKIAEKFKEAK